MFENAKPNADGVLEIGVEELKPVLSDVKLIDVRRDDEFSGELGHIQGAELITLETEFSKRVKSLDPDTCYVFVCRSGVRSSKAASVAKSYGITKVYNLAGGMIAWNKKSYPVEI